MWSSASIGYLILWWELIRRCNPLKAEVGIHCSINENKRSWVFQLALSLCLSLVAGGTRRQRSCDCRVIYRFKDTRRDQFLREPIAYSAHYVHCHFSQTFTTFETKGREWNNTSPNTWGELHFCVFLPIRRLSITEIVIVDDIRIWYEKNTKCFLFVFSSNSVEKLNLSNITFILSGSCWRSKSSTKDVICSLKKLRMHFYLHPTSQKGYWT